jgi:hypothetical protein
MKYLKTFEDINEKRVSKYLNYEIGDYVKTGSHGYYTEPGIIVYLDDTGDVWVRPISGGLNTGYDTLNVEKMTEEEVEEIKLKNNITRYNL